MKPDFRVRAAQAGAAGRDWAKSKADHLSGAISAVDWPDLWNASDAGSLPFDDTGLTAQELSMLSAIANHAAAERWREIVHDARRRENLEADELDEEARTVRLVELLRFDLPEGLWADHDGARAYLIDREGIERTVSSLENAWRVVAEYEEHHSLRT